jgi:hypothetical protein
MSPWLPTAMGFFVSEQLIRVLIKKPKLRQKRADLSVYELYANVIRANVLNVARRYVRHAH